MGFGTVSKKVAPRVPLRHGEGNKDHLTSVGGLAALSLDALSSVAYGPQAIVLVLVAAGTSALRLTLPITLAIAGLLAVLIVSYCQVIAVHPDGGGAYAVGKKDLGATVSLLAAASLVVDYVLTVAVSLAAGAASLASAFPSLVPARSCSATWRFSRQALPASELEQRLLDDFGERWMDVENAGGDLVDCVPEAHRLD
jgi:amino acid transporter